MKRLILLRHAKSSWTDERLADAERPLSDRGVRDAPRMGARLHERGIRPDLVLSSPAVRAQSTAKLVADALAYPADAIRLEASLYLAAPEDILGVVGEQPDTVECLLVVGHNPGLTDLAHILLPDFDVADLPTMGVVAIETAAVSWSGIRGAHRRLAFYDYPRNPAPAITAR
jgi:phosphohistidine phosphatase